MKVLATMIPVFFMICLGFISNRKQLILKEQANGMYEVISKVFVPIMVFNAIFTSNIDGSVLYIIVVVFLIHIFGIVIGKLTSNYINKQYAHVIPYLMCTVDGGNVCFPLYATIVGTSYIGNIVLLDIANMIIVFLVIPLMVTTTSKQKNIKELLKMLFHNTIVVTLMLAFILKFVGLYKILSISPFLEVYESVVSMAIGPVIGVILFMIGYQFRIEKSSFHSLIKSITLRCSIMGVGILALLFIFPNMMHQKVMLIAILLYFMCPPALILQIQIKEICKSENDVSFISAFTSLYMLITLVTYSLIAIFI